MTPLRIAINGFGRIGRVVLRQLLTSPHHSDIKVVAINDIAPIETCAYLFKYDSVYGPCPLPVCIEAGDLRIGDHAIPLHRHENLRDVDLGGVDVLLECTGRATTREVAQAGLIAGARSVLISGPSQAADVTTVLGANDHELANARIVSNSSCTTNAIAPLLCRLDQSLGINRAHITTIHCYTGSQPTVDVPGPSLERSRAAANSMIPTTTSAATQITQVCPQMSGRLSVAAVRVPSLSVSAIDAVVQLQRTPKDEVHEAVRNICADGHIIGKTDDPCVSSDMRGRPESLVIALPELQMIGETQLRLFGWYDNEWGFSARMVDMARKIAARTLS
ncbi:type I glyceraldehyde-3-phosphate dehydrogenase [Nereida sp. MMG025]|uniref:type I glyceraldehyde-3-phosphate dehydrogenase n=1 Tax=Nereida sp. MMG025 TaxID=2909981 RepID=UPI001F1B4A6F|nr:glyceraldehyde 3-phosphate dehydrogenase NAD-binding domain-containing protein [Nereida sp. MMG025]MCF6443747.1 aldehyde dehydrogenase [Nereida sp. MMG025]